MPTGKEIGSYKSKSTSMTVTNIDGDQRTIEVNMEGEVSGQLSGTVVSTVIYTGTNDRGSYSDKGVGFLESGVLHGEGMGVYWLEKPGEWETRGAVTLGNGQTVIAEGRVNLAKRTWNGKLFELE